MEINKEDFIYWRHHPVTAAFQEAMIVELDKAKAWLMNEAGRDAKEDRFMVGQIKGVQWLIDWVPEFIEDENNGIDSEGPPAAY